ncbi:MAG: chitobiase/beta-hexosaminidase C-terminal domain-containing protein [Sphaerochaeta sp.]|nr:chitobiase/beta-hexosaminidase C-terminal domain-containing protein [Sphaerochaeta sp.]
MKRVQFSAVFLLVLSFFSLVFISCPGPGENQGSIPPTFSLGTTKTLDSPETLVITGIDGTTIYYTLDGSTPTSTPTEACKVYSEELFINENTTVKAITVHADFPDSEVTSATYKIRAGSPQFSLEEGSSYSGQQELTFTSETPGASILYTIDGSDPRTSGIQYSAGNVINITEKTTVKAISRKTNMEDSAEISKSYDFLTPANTPIISPVTGTYATKQTISMTTSDGGEIRYTLDGTTPNEESMLYGSPFELDRNTLVKAITVKSGLGNSTVAEVDLKFNARIPDFYLAENTYDSPQLLEIRGMSGQTYYYTLDGSLPTSTPSETCKLYSAKVTISQNTTVKAIAAHPAFEDSLVKSATYKIKAGVPSFSPAEETHDRFQEVSLSTVTPEATIYYTTNGDVPSSASTKYVDPFIVDYGTTTVKAFSMKANMEDSAVSDKTYIILNKSHEITLDAQGGTSSSATKLVTDKVRYGTMPTAERYGYDFGGWYTEKDGKGSNITEDTKITSNHFLTLYAKWTLSKSTITFDKQGGTGGSITAIAIYSKEVPISGIYAPTREGYQFCGYYDAESEGKQYYTDSMKAPNMWDVWDKVSDTVVLYARWNNTFDVILDYRDGLLGKETVSITYGSAMPAATAPTRDGYTFGGYYSKEAGAGTQYYNESMESTNNWDKIFDSKLYAYWTSSYKVGDIGPGGGLIFYIHPTFNYLWNYLEAAPSGWDGGTSDPSMGYSAKKNGKFPTLNTNPSLGYGKYNTIAILEKNEVATSAAGKCSTYSVDVNGATYDDWFLPSSKELQSMFAVLGGDTTIGGFSDEYYWSSYETTYLWHAFHFSGGDVVDISKEEGILFSVRPVRSF